MKLLHHYLCRLVFFTALILFSGPLFAYIPPELEFTAVFDYQNEPVSGNQTVTVRLFTSGELVYKEVVKDVYFDKGVGKIIIGGENSDLINDYFYDPDMVVAISVMQHKLTFPVNSVPYTIRTKESNKARRIDNESIVKFLEEEQRIGVNELSPKVTFDVNGVIVLNDKLNSDQLSNGVVYYSGNDNTFLTYRDGTWVSMSWIPEPEDRSKWVLNTSNSSIRSAKSVGIGRVPNTYGLSVSENVLISSDVSFNGHLDVFGSAKLSPSNYGFESDARLSAPSIQFLSSSNQWSSSGHLTFSGVLHGKGTGLTNVHHFEDGSFSSQHIALGSIENDNFISESIWPNHMALNMITTSNVATNQVTSDYIGDYAIEANHIVDRSIQTHHMRKNEISSEDIKLNTFNNEKYADDAIHSYHIVDGEITGAKIISHNITQAHLKPNDITSEKIKNGTLSGGHVPLQSLAISNYSGVFPVSAGGTGQSTFQNYGVLYANSSSEYASNASLFAIQDGRMGIGGLPETGVQLSIQRDFNSRVGIVADAAFPSTLMLRNSMSNWDMKVNSSGTLSFMSDNFPVFSLTVNGKMAVGTENATEVLTLTGPLVLGPSKASGGSGDPGSMKYDGGQFSVYTSSWAAITSGQLSKRFFDPLDRQYAQRSSVIFSHDSAIIGDHLMVRSAASSTLMGQALDVGTAQSSTISGALSTVDSIHQSDVQLLESKASFLIESQVDLERSSLALAQRSQVRSKQSSHVGLLDSAIDSESSSGRFIDGAHLELSQSEASFLSQSKGQLTQSSLSFVQDSILAFNRSDGHFLDSVDGVLDHSNARYISTSQMNISDSTVQNVSHSKIQGQGHLILGGSGHDIQADDHIGLLGNHHDVIGHRSVAIGDHVQVKHDDVVLLNSSNQPLSSDRPGQLKIQADGGVRIQFSDDMGISMTDSMGGWSHISDESMKMSKFVVDPMMVLNKVRQLPIQYWQYKSQKDIQHIGPTAQDFYGLFNYGNSNKVIHSIDSDGVLLASIKGLSFTLDELQRLLVEDIEIFETQSKDTRRILAKVEQLKPRVDVMEKKYIHNFRLLDQFESDFNSQQDMIGYIKDHVQRLHWVHYLTMIEGGIVALLGLGGLVGIVMYLFLRRFRERSL
ncbi:hypothetical protein DID73_00455 [Candidatus Marinamargulisbacteria bacterium SCGC AG-343-K17]|nr:hypothetical protein DID73_00455 [Candidatus Marinamargulisbacteria bacterium SCGC AG-343-K17]